MIFGTHTLQSIGKDNISTIRSGVHRATQWHRHATGVWVEIRDRAHWKSWCGHDEPFGFEQLEVFHTNPQTLMLYKIHRLHGWNAERHVIQVFFSLDLYNTHTHTHRDTFFLITYTCSSTLLMFWFPWCIGTVWIQHIQYISSWELWCSSLWLV